jgi:hypothetical protein
MCEINGAICYQYDDIYRSYLSLICINGDRYDNIGLISFRIKTTEDSFKLMNLWYILK